jgi:sugar phosphate isomerase/epimerase
MALGIAVNLYSAREAMADDLEGTLETIVRLGYRHVEPAGYHGRSVDEFKQLLEANGLRAVSSHVPWQRFDTELEVVIGEGKVLGLEALVVPWLSPEQRNESFIRELPIKLNDWGERVVQAGMRLAWHNHDFEFQIEVGERTLMDILLADVHPEYVDLEPDLYWIAAAGLDPLIELREMHPRVRTIHAKDRAPDGSIANVGQGLIDWQAVVTIAREQFVDWLIVEHDQPADLESDLRASYDYLSSLIAVD